MPVNILEQFSDGNYSNLGQHYQSIQIPKYNLKHIMEKEVVIPIYISSGADKNIELNNPNYLKYIKENYSEYYKKVKAMKIDDLWRLALNGGCLIEINNTQSANQALSIVKCITNKIMRDDGCLGGTLLESLLGKGYMNIIFGDKKYNKKSFTFVVMRNKATNITYLQITD